MEVVVNKCYGGFGLSPKAVTDYAKLAGIEIFLYVDNESVSEKEYKKISLEDLSKEDHFIVYYLKTDVGDLATSKEINAGEWLNEHDLDRSDKNLITVIRTLGKEANGNHSELCIIEIPDDVKWEIGEYDGMEHVQEKHRTWY